MSDDNKGGSDLDIFEGLGKSAKGSERKVDAPPPPPGSGRHVAAQPIGEMKKTLLGIPNPAPTTPNLGNLAETVNLSSVLAAGLTMTGLPPSVTLQPNQSTTVPITLTPAVNTPLNSTRSATITAQFNPLDEVYDLIRQALAHTRLRRSARPRAGNHTLSARRSLATWRAGPPPPALLPAWALDPRSSSSGIADQSPTPDSRTNRGRHRSPKTASSP